MLRRGAAEGVDELREEPGVGAEVGERKEERRIERTYQIWTNSELNFEEEEKECLRVERRSRELFNA